MPGGVLLVPPGTTLVPGRVLVRFRPGVALSARSEAVSHVNASVETAYSLVPRLELLRLQGTSTVESAVAALSRDPRVQYAVPDLSVKVTATPNDPSYASQWALQAIHAPAAWDRSTGTAGITVAVLDTGAVLTHPDLAANLVPGWNFVNNTSDPSDDYGHGTHVAGIIGAVGNNATGIVGINWHVSLMPLKICNGSGQCDLGEEISALQYAVAHGAKIANASFGGPYGSYQPEEDAIAAAGQAGLLYVAAAGNSSTNNDYQPFYPASYPLDNLISVAATTSGGGLASFSDYGFNSVQIGAPGQSILSTLPTSGPLSDPSGYGYESGTSMAAPEVTGAAALLWAEHPDWTMQQVRMRLLETASPLASLEGMVADCGQLNVGAATDPAVADHAIVCVGLSGTGGGSVTSDQAGLSCSGAGCMQTVPPGTTVTLTAAPSSGSTFAGWSGACSGSGTCTVTASGISDVTATFRGSGSPPGWQQKRLHSPAARDPFAPGSSPDFTFYNASVSGDGSERAETIYNPPTTGNVSYCYYDTTDTGGVFLERHTSAGWVSDGEITAPSLPAWSGDGGARWGNCSSFGGLTQLSADGTTLLVAPDSTIVSSSVIKYRCAAYVYRRGSGGAWSLEGALYPPGIDAGGSDTPAGCGYFGNRGVLSGDGNRVTMLAQGFDSSGNSNGVIYADIYVRSLGAWSLEQQLTISPPATNCGEFHVPALSGDGSILLIGSDTCNDGGLTVAGIVYAYQRTGSVWTLAQTIQSPQPASFERFGESTTISPDGNTAVIGSDRTSGNATWVFERGGSGWQMSALLSYPTRYYACPSIVKGGARIFCQGSQENVGFNSGQGAVYIYDRPAGGWASATPQAQRAFATDGFGADYLGAYALDAPEDGSFVDAVMSYRNLASGAYPNDRIGYEFTTGQIDQTLNVATAGAGSGAITSNPAGIDCGSVCSHDYAAGTTVTLTAAPQAGFTGWSGACTGTGTCTVTMDQDRSVTATFAVIHEPLIVSVTGAGSGTVTSVPSGISCHPTCSSSFTYGTNVALTATPAAGSVFTGWTGACTGTGGCSVTMDQARSVTAAFAPTEQLSAAKAGTGHGSVTSSPAGIDCGSTCAHAYGYGTSVQLTAIPAIGSAFTGWSGACSGTGSCTVTMSQARVVTASFAKRPPVTLKVSRVGSGSVISHPSGINCGTACSHRYSYGTKVTLIAHPASAYVLTGWSGACAGTTSATCVLSMTAASAAKATFAPAKLLTLLKSGTGTGKVTSTPAGIACTSTCTHLFKTGTVVTLTATPNSGSKFTGWGGACSGTGTCVVTMSAAKTVNTTFTPVAALHRSARRHSLLASVLLLVSHLLRLS